MGTQAVELPFAPSTLLARHAKQPFVFLLDGQGERSWATGEAWFGFAPTAVLRVDALDHGQVERRGVIEVQRGDPLSLLQRFCEANVAPHEPDGRSVLVALNYDLRRSIERFGAGPPSDPPLPLLVAAAYDWTLSYSYRAQRYSLHSAAGMPVTQLCELLQLDAGATCTDRPSSSAALINAERSRAEHEHAVQVVLDYIAAGDVYQVNLAQRFSGRGHFDAPAVFARMQEVNRVPFAAYADVGACRLISNSPECLLRLNGTTVSTFPIKGTRRRSPDANEDRREALALLADAKERAEHVMVVDLERNDLGRVCRVGSVHVAAFAELQSFPGLHHLVSCVRGERRKDVGLADLLGAIFPSGSVTGAPKIRAMQIIDALEPYSRGFYTGGLGYIRSLDDAVFSLTIRTAMLQAERIWYWAGGGIVADSNAAREFDETMLKAQPFLVAVSGTRA